MISNLISSFKAHELVKKGAQLIDVRTVGEFNQGCLPGAENFPVSAIEQLSADLDNKRDVIVYCRTGGRSARAKQILDNKGFTSVYNIGSMTNF